MGKRKKRQTIGKMANSRIMWERKPTTQVQKGKKKYDSRTESKQKLRKGQWD